MIERKEIQAYPQTNLSNQLLQHQKEMLQFMFYTNYDIVYETFELKHGSYAQRNRGQLIQTFKSDQIRKNFLTISEKLHIRILRDDIDLDKLLGRLQLLWHNRNLPYFHRYYVEKYLFTAYIKNIGPSIEKEEQLIKTEHHIYYPLFKSINARQACLRSLKKLLAELNSEDVYEYLHVAKQRLFNEKRKVERQKYKAQGYKLKIVEETVEGKTSKTKFQLFSDCFNHLTKLTLYVLELILRWKDYIASLTHDIRKQKQRMEYYFYDDNYLLKILTDLGFLKVSFLSQFYSFAPKNDPFLLQCVLGFEKKAQKTVQHQLLKLIFMPQKEHLAEILNKLELLSEQYRYNIRSRKVYDLNVLKKPMIRAEQKILNNNQNELVSNIVLKKIESPMLNKKAKSVTTFRVKQQAKSAGKKEQIVIQFKKTQSPLRKKLASIPGAVQKTFIQQQKESPLKNSVILQKNQAHNHGNIIDDTLLNTLKLQVIRKVREDFKVGDSNKKKQNEALQFYINSRVNEAIKSIFPFQPEKQLKKPMQMTHKFIQQSKLIPQIQNMFKQSLYDYRQMQYGSADLIKIIQNSPYIYTIDASIGDQVIGRVICTLESEVTEFKVIKILYVHFPDLSQLEFLVMETVKYMWKYENCFEVHFHFFQPSGHQPIKQLLEGLQGTLQRQCLFGRKQLYSTVMQIKLIFKRPDKNINYFPNLYPFSCHLQFRLLLSHRKLMLQNRNQHKHLQLLDYDYFLMQAIKRLLKSEDILVLKEKIHWKDRLKHLLQMLKQEEENDLMTDQIVQIEANNISQLNNQLTKSHEQLLEVSDIVKANNLTLLSFRITLTPNYPLKTAVRANNIQYYRYSIKKKLAIRVDQQGAEFYFLRVKQHFGYQIILFNAKNYLHTSSDPNSWLSLYLSERVTEESVKTQKIEKQIENLWVPMCRFPIKFKERQQTFLHTARIADFVPLKIDVLLGEKLQMLCNTEMQNSIRYNDHHSDIILQYPMGIAIAALPSRTIIYSRVFR